MTAVKTYRKKPIEVQAVQFDGENWTQVWTLAGSKSFGPVDPEDRGEDPEIVAEVFDKLHSTWVGVKQGQWIIKGVQGEFYPCDEDVFAATYEEVSG